MGFDNIPDIQSLIKTGEVLATVDQFGVQQAIFGIDKLLKLISEQPVAGWIKPDIMLITSIDLTS